MCGRRTCSLFGRNEQMCEGRSSDAKLSFPHNTRTCTHSHVRTYTRPQAQLDNTERLIRDNVAFKSSRAKMHDLLGKCGLWIVSYIAGLLYIDRPVNGLIGFISSPTRIVPICPVLCERCYPSTLTIHSPFFSFRPHELARARHGGARRPACPVDAQCCDCWRVCGAHIAFQQQLDGDRAGASDPEAVSPPGRSRR